MKNLLPFVLATLVVCGAGCDDHLPVAPNIVLIVADDAGWNDVGYHNAEIITPNIDSMAKAGVVMDNFYVYPTCSPTRAALLTGRYASRFGIYKPIAMKSKQVLPSGVITLPGLLRNHGYQTAICGKWHLGLRPENGPLQYGFDYSYGFLHGQIDQQTHLYKNGDRSWHRMDRYTDEQGHATDLIAREAIEYVMEKREKAKPFFLYVPFSVPHYPVQESGVWIDRYKGHQMSESRKMFAASMSHMDQAIGRLMTALKNEGLLSNTLVVFISDNGGQLSWTPTFEYNLEHGPYPQLGDNTPLRGSKGEVYEGGIRVPAIFYWPEVLPASEEKTLIKITDLFPTLAALGGVSQFDSLSLDGNNIWPLLKGQELEAERELYLRTNQSIMLRKGSWKFIHHATSLDSTNSELFDIENDPYETKNLATHNPEKFQFLWEALKEEVIMENQLLLPVESPENHEVKIK